MTQYFAPIDRGKRIQIASRTFDLGEYLARLHKQGELKTDFTPIPVTTVYYPPCHLRSQKIGEPYAVLSERIPQLKIKKIEGDSYCCGPAGIMGLKLDFYDASIEMVKGLLQLIGGSILKGY